MTKYYAKDNQISTSPLDGGIKITQAQYQSAIEALSNGQNIVLRSEKLRILSNQMIDIYNAELQVQQIAENDDIPEGWTATPPAAFEKLVNGQWVTDQDALRAAKVTLLADVRWGHETSGVELDGVKFWTTRDSIPQWARMVEKAKADPGFIVPAYKAMDGYVADLTAAQILAADAAGEAHITKCFMAEMLVINMIDGLDLADVGEAFTTAYNGVEL